MADQEDAGLELIPYRVTSDDSPRFVLIVRTREAQLNIVLGDGDAVMIDRVFQKDTSAYLRGFVEGDAVLTLDLIEGLIHVQAPDLDWFVQCEHLHDEGEAE